jgi:uncharacterized protein
MTNLFPRIGDWMQTYTGQAFWPLDPRIEEIDPLDIAHALSMICRYGGHTRRFYSVAEHCVLISEWVETETGSREDALAALLHDAAEAYVGDMIRPLKYQLSRYQDIERRILSLILARFGLGPRVPKIVKEADNRILLTERQVVMQPPPRTWGSVEGLDPLPVRLHLWGPMEATGAYYERLMALLDERNAA